MTIVFYKVLHIVGLAMLLLGTGAALFAPKDGPKQRLPMILHGVGLLVLLIAGFGAMAKLGLSAPHDWPAWLILKMVVWFLAASMPALVRHGTVPKPVGWVVAVLLVASAAWLAIAKPSFG
ncbi:MAG: hypothetical protein AB7O97_02560 [Planctomycetota bacterium]